MSSRFNGRSLAFMLQQALLYGRVPYPPLSPAPALQRSQMVVDEIMCRCDILARIMQEYSGETVAHEARVRAHIQRMEHSPTRRVRARREGIALVPAASTLGKSSGEGQAGRLRRKITPAQRTAEEQKVWYFRHSSLQHVMFC